MGKGMEVEGTKMGGVRKILGVRLQWEWHVDGERYGSGREEDGWWREDTWDEAAMGRAHRWGKVWKWKGRRRVVEGRYMG